MTFALTLLRLTHVQEQDLRKFGSLLLDRLGESFTRLGPWRPKVQARDSLQVGREQYLEVLGRGDFDKIRHGGKCLIPFGRASPVYCHEMVKMRRRPSNL